MGPRTLLAVAACAIASVAIAACGDGSESAGGSCRPAVRWSGQQYTGDVTGKDLPPTGATVTPKATKLGCIDQGPTPVTARQLQGVAPTLALRIDRTTVLYLPTGVFTELAGHPLHDAFWGSPSKPYRRGDGKRCDEHGSVQNVTLFDFELKTDAEVLRVVIDARTKITGAPLRGGQPLVREGATVDVRGRRCAADANLDGRLTARRIAVR